MEPRQRVAIVGSGLAGLVSAHLLSNDGRQRYAVTVFESGASLSLDSASITIPNADQTSSARVDLPMRAFAGGFYHNLKALYDYLEIPYHSQPFLFEFAKFQAGTGDRKSSYFIHASNLHQVAPRPNAIGVVSYIVEVVYLLVCYGWFSLCCFLIRPQQGEMLRQYLKRTWTSQRFITYYLLPLVSSVTTCPHEALLDSPASDLTEYKRKTHRAPHYTVLTGVKAVQDRLVQGIECKLGAMVKAVEPQEKGVKILWQQNEGEARTEYFDKVILAVAPDVVGHVFEPLRYHMARIPTTQVESVVHSDRCVLADTDIIQKAADRHGAQLICLRTSTNDIHKTESHHVQPCGVIVTTCPHNSIDPALVIRSARFTRVLRSPESQRIVNAVFNEGQPINSYEKSVPQWRNGDDNVWLAGGWCWDGMVLLEGCVVSATRVAIALGIDVPWLLKGGEVVI